jgi:hypothetical protein
MAVGLPARVPLLFVVSGAMNEVFRASHSPAPDSFRAA